MNPTLFALIAFACVFGGTLLGMLIRTSYAGTPFELVNREDVIKLGMGLIATIAALVLGLVIATAKSSYDTQNDAIKHSAAKILLLDRVLAQYGPQTKETRDLMRHTPCPRESIKSGQEEGFNLHSWIHHRWSLTVEWPGGQNLATLAAERCPARDSSPRALQIAGDILETRWLVFGGLGSSIPVPLSRYRYILAHVHLRVFRRFRSTQCHGYCRSCSVRCRLPAQSF